jgi:large subunit ribosomal protein L19
MQQLLRKLSAAFTRPRPDVRPGFTVRVHERIKEGDKERVQVFEGLVIRVHKGATLADTTFTVRRIASGIGVEKTFPLHSPNITKIEVKKVAKVRRSKLFFLRGRQGKAARLSERFTTADEFAVAVEAEDKKPKEEVEIVEAPEEKDEKEEKEAKGENEKPQEEAAEEKKEEAEEEKKEAKNPDDAKKDEEGEKTEEDKEKKE